MQVNWLDLLQQYVSIPYLLTFILLSYALKDLGASVLVGLSSRIKFPKQTVVLLIGVFVGMVFFYAFGEDRIKLAVSYAVGTSMYDLVIDYIVGKIKGSIVKTDG